MLHRTVLGAAIAVAALSSATAPAWASPIFTSNATISGTTFGFGPSAMPWTAEIFATPGQCLRLAVLSQSTDLEATVVAPNGTVFRDDDSGPGTQPLVKINSTPNNGWYTVSINNFAGAAVSSNFSLQIQRLALNSASCLPATAPSLAVAVARKANSANSPAPAAGEPGSN